MTATDTFEAQKKLVETLISAGICSGRVYDKSPDSPSRDDGKGSRSHPYCVVDDSLDEPDDLGSNPRTLMFQTVQIWSRYRGKKEVREIAQAVHDAVHTNEYTLPGDVMMRVIRQNTQIFPDTDGRSYRGVIRLRLTLTGDC